MPAPLIAAALPGIISAGTKLIERLFPDPAAQDAAKLGTKLIERLFPDPAAQDAAKLELFKMQQSGELAALASETELAKGQLEINKEEAKAGPFRGWTCGAGLAYNFVLRPLFTFVLEYNGIPGELPALDLSELMPLILGMLGLGGMRSWEKTKGLS
jgi:hypothetical protein